MSTALCENEGVRVRPFLLLAALALSFVAGCVVDSSGGGKEAQPTASSATSPGATVTVTVTATVTATITVTASPTAPAPGQVDVRVLNRPRGEPCAGVTVVSSFGDATLDQAVTDANGHATLAVAGGAAASDVAALVSPGPPVARIGIHDRDQVLLPAFCLPAETLNLDVTFVATTPNYEAMAGIESMEIVAPVGGTSGTFALSLDVSRRLSNAVALTGAAGYFDGSLEVGVTSPVALTATAATITMHPTTPQAVQLIAVNAPAWVAAVDGSAATTRADTLTGMNTGIESLTPTGTGAWTTTFDVPGLEISDGIIGLVSTLTPGDGLVIASFRQTGTSTVAVDLSALPPLLSNTVAFDGTTADWTITDPGDATLGVAWTYGVDGNGTRQLAELLFPPDLCSVGPCALKMPPELRMSLTNPDVVVSYLWRPTLAGYPSFESFFFGPYRPEGLWIISSTNGPVY